MKHVRESSTSSSTAIDTSTETENDPALLEGKGRAVLIGDEDVMRVVLTAGGRHREARRVRPSVVGRQFGDDDVIEAVSGAARLLGIKAYELDWRIWEASRGGSLPYPTAPA